MTAPLLVRFDALPPQPWRNGGGVTRELLAWPRADDWRVRVSVADITRDGPFSSFEGVARWFAVLTGDGVRLGDDPVEVLASGDAHGFDGASAPACALRGGPTRDLNLMLRAAHVEGEMRRVDDVFEWPERGRSGCLRAVFTRDGCALTTGAETLAVPAMALAWAEVTDGGRWRCEATRPSSTWAIDVWRRADVTPV